MSDPRDAPPLTALLSFAIVAFTIELDNEFERCMPHRTTDHGPSRPGQPGPWLVSLAMWSTCMSFVGDEGVTVDELERLARTPTNLAGMERWGYVTVEPATASAGRRSGQADAVVRPTRAGRRAREVWEPLPGAIEERWRGRFGGDAVDAFGRSLAALDCGRELALPDCLPILHYGLGSADPDRWRAAPAD